jgi:predicted Zn-dependent protease
MQLCKIVGKTLLGLGALVLVACEPAASHQAGVAPQTSAVRSGSEQREGDQNHAKIVAQYGGVYQNARVTGYVNAIGQRIAAVSEQPNARWTFTVLDTPTVNAFAIPGGYVYVTRGLVALAGDEAQLAGVIGHEIGHVVAGHSAAPARHHRRAWPAGRGNRAGGAGSRSQCRRRADGYRPAGGRRLPGAVFPQ